jgi:hypothetical protein
MLVLVNCEIQEQGVLAMETKEEISMASLAGVLNEE